MTMSKEITKLFDKYKYYDDAPIGSFSEDNIAVLVDELEQLFAKREKALIKAEKSRIGNAINDFKKYIVNRTSDIRERENRMNFVEELRKYLSDSKQKGDNEPRD